MTTEIEGKQRSLNEVFGGEYVYSIPRYQRPYAWTKENAEQLFDDLVAALGTTGAPVDKLDPYFLGCVVLIKEQGRPSSAVVDGQQRLTTLSMLLAALRETLEENGHQLAPLLYVTANVFSGTAAQYRLTLREQDAAFFRTHIQEAHGFARLRALEPKQIAESQRRLRENALLLFDRLKALGEQERRRLAEFLVRRCYLIVVSTPNLDAAYRIFSVLNDRGLDLSHTDILKAEVIGEISPEELQAKYARLWEDLESSLGKEGFEDVFTHIRTIHLKTKLRGTILDEFRKSVRPAARPKAFIDEVLTPLSDAYKTIRKAAYQSMEGAEAVNLQLRRLNRIDNFDWMPAAMLYLWRRPPDAGALAAYLQGLERQAAIMMITRANVNQRLERFAQIMTELEADRDPFRADSPVLAADAKDRASARQRLGEDIYAELKTRLFILTRLDEELTEGGATYDRSMCTIEHILPQNPEQGSQWLLWFPDEQERADWTGRLANLVLLSGRKNSEAQNFEFDVKKNTYFQSLKTKSTPFALTTDVFREAEWTPAVLAKRQERLLGVLAQAWRL